MLLNDLSHVADVGGMVKMTPIIVQMQGYRSLHVCSRVSCSLEGFLSIMLHLTLHLAISALNTSYVSERSCANAAYIVGSLSSCKSANLDGN